ncbi:cell wall hydrolase [Stakelama marina]|uniref:cell wall hydrolase n=1 Tax=Stakelama marina TaxID=2826939 RepID=UPI0024C26C40|nr:cell wall hydrolase [Stakelama marina]
MTAIAAPALIVANVHTPAPHAGQAAAPEQASAAPLSTPPPVEPFRIRDLDPDQAREYNASIPFVSGALQTARAFNWSSGSEDRERALDCLATAVLYEAGDDTTGEKAVAQVVLNRVRHPAFPDTVCGVVFQGAERNSGCQFTFTCDGSLARTYSSPAWDRARTVARLALQGSVDKAVGNATHYHTDWVVPYWSAHLDKIARVETHLFFRWSGWWGTPAAFKASYRGGEPRIEKLAGLFDAHKSAEELAKASVGTIDAATIAGSALPQPLDSNPDTFLVTIDPALDPATLPALARRACGDRSYCKFMSWAGNAPSKLPLSANDIRTMAFSYLRNRAGNFDKALWNCDLFQRSDASQCMRRSAPMPENDFALENLPGTRSVSVPGPLKGVRRKTGRLMPVPADNASGD